MQSPLKSQYNSSQILKRQFSASYGKRENPGYLKIILNNKSTPESLTIPDFKLYCGGKVIKNSMALILKQTWNHIEDADINPYPCECMIFDKEARNILWLQQMEVIKLDGHM